MNVDITCAAGYIGGSVAVALIKAGYMVSGPVRLTMAASSGIISGVATPNRTPGWRLAWRSAHVENVHRATGGLPDRDSSIQADIVCSGKSTVARCRR